MPSTSSDYIVHFRLISLILKFISLSLFISSNVDKKRHEMKLKHNSKIKGGKDIARERVIAYKFRI